MSVYQVLAQPAMDAGRWFTARAPAGLPGATWSDPTAAAAGIASVLVAVALFVAWRVYRREHRARAALARVLRGGRVTEPLARGIDRLGRELRRGAAARAEIEGVFDGLGCSVAVVNGDERVVRVNRCLAELLGLEDHGGPLRLADLFGVEADVVRALLTSVEVDVAIPRVIECELIAADGRRAPALISASRIDDDRVVLVALEIGDLRRIEERLHQINLQLWLMNELTAIALRVRELEPAVDQMARALRESSCYRAAGIAVLDQEEGCLRFSCLAGFGDVDHTHARRLAGSFLATVLENREPILLQAPDGHLEFDDVLLDAVDARVFGAFPLVVDGRGIGLLMLAGSDLLGSIEAFGHSGGDLARHLAPLLQQKLTNEELRRSNHDLEAARNAAEQANRAKSDFLANMSHEIRTPMTAILGYADLVREGGLSADDTNEFIATIRRNGEHLLAIINDILDISKIESGHMEIEALPCSPAALISEVAGMMRARAESKGVTLVVDARWPVPRCVSSDPTRLRQILNNLVGNAIKFTNRGEVRLVLRTERGEDGAELLFEVVDSGIGLSAVELTRIFRPFSQADSSHTRRFGGTGLGLTISQRFARLLGGSLSVQSSKGQGSTFTLRVPWREAAGPQGLAQGWDDVGWDDVGRGDVGRGDVGRGGAERRAPVVPDATALDLRVLLAEDGVDNRRLVSFVLRKAGVDVEVVADGEQAVRAAVAAEDAGAPFAVILMDMQMPVLDGYAATSELRARGYRAPILALTAHAMEGDRDRCLAAGCDGFLTKPIDRTALLDAVFTAAARAPHGAE